MTDPNDLLHLGLYLFYPGRVAVGTLAGGVEAVSYGVSFAAAPPVSPALARPYLQAAAGVLLGPQPSTERAVDARLRRFAMQQLLPLFQRYEPERAAEISHALSSLGAYTQPAASAGAADYTDEGLSVSDLVKSIEQLKTQGERDHHLFTSIKVAVDRGDFESARVLASRVGADDLRQQALEWVGFNEAQVAIKRGELESASKIAATQLTQERRTVIYSQLASSWLERDDFVRAGEEVAAAVVAATKIEDRGQRARIYIFLAAGMTKRDAQRAFEFMETAAREINAAEQFNPADDRVTFTIKTPFSSYRFLLSDGVGLISAAAQLASSDLNRALTTARAIEPPAPRALSIIAACRATLRKAAPRKSNTGGEG